MTLDAAALAGPSLIYLMERADLARPRFARHADDVEVAMAAESFFGDSQLTEGQYTQVKDALTAAYAVNEYAAVGVLLSTFAQKMGVAGPEEDDLRAAANALIASHQARLAFGGDE